MRETPKHMHTHTNGTTSHKETSCHDHPAHEAHHHSHHHHHHGHSHGHGHHGHVHAPASFGVVFLISILINSAYIVGEVSWGIFSHSISLLADAGHNLSDVLGLLAAWGAQALAKRSPSSRFTYGLKRATILTALANATILLLVTGGIIWEAIWHLLYPETVHGQAVSIVAFVGILINGGTALLLMRGADHDLNMRGAFLHMASDALMALGVVIAGGIITYTGFSIIDPLTSLVVSALIIWGTWSLLTHALGLALDGVPRAIDPAKVEKALRDLPEIADLHHLHIWPISTTETALTVHLVLTPFAKECSLHQAQEHTSTLLARATNLLQSQFSIGHPTFQIETMAPHSCAMPACAGDKAALNTHTHAHIHS